MAELLFISAMIILILIIWGLDNRIDELEDAVAVLIIENKLRKE